MGVLWKIYCQSKYQLYLYYQTITCFLSKRISIKIKILINIKFDIIFHNFIGYNKCSFLILFIKKTKEYMILNL